MIALLSILACGTPGQADAEPVVEPVVEVVYIDGMWGERVLTVIAGLEEAQGKLDAGEPQAAADLCAAVYRGSFEPELEPMIRARLGRREAASTEYDFGLVRAALRDGDGRGARKASDQLVATLTVQAEALDQARSVLTD